MMETNWMVFSLKSSVVLAGEGKAGQLLEQEQQQRRNMNGNISKLEFQWNKMKGNEVRIFLHFYFIQLTSGKILFQTYFRIHCSIFYFPSISGHLTSQFSSSELKLKWHQTYYERRNLVELKYFYCRWLMQSLGRPSVMISTSFFHKGKTVCMFHMRGQQWGIVFSIISAETVSQNNKL